MNPWHPMTDSIDLKHMGKLAEESGELATVAARCIIQGIDEQVPGENKTNKRWLEEEAADVLANISLVVKHFRLNVEFIYERADMKMDRLEQWHAMA